MYEEIAIEDGSSYIKKTDGDSVSWIPVNIYNADYQEYLLWKAEQEGS